MGPPKGSGYRWGSGLGLIDLLHGHGGRGHRRVRELEGLKGHGKAKVRRRGPLIGVLLDADGMVVRVAVSPRDMVFLDGRFSIPHHHVQNGNHPAQNREGPEKS
jgi:hypothetical protein